MHTYRNQREKKSNDEAKVKIGGKQKVKDPITVNIMKTPLKKVET